MSKLFVRIKSYGGECPVQVQGRVNGFPFYLRLRGAVEFTVCDKGDDPTDVFPSGFNISSHGLLVDPLGEWEHSTEINQCSGYPGYATVEEVMDCLTVCVEKYAAWLRRKESQ